MKTYKWIATKGTRNQRTLGAGFFTKKDAEFFARRENRRHDSGYFVARVSDFSDVDFF
jgi:hypothetical protein